MKFESWKQRLNAGKKASLTLNSSTIITCVSKKVPKGIKNRPVNGPDQSVSNLEKSKFDHANLLIR